ncbi:hypothetical protein MPER_00501, partial [Moniliophthora perniciosa FA553]
DIGAHGVIHTDVTAFNILHFTGDAVTCPRHNVVHNWRIIDFDRSCKIDMDQACNYTKRALEDDVEHIGKRALFWGNLLHTLKLGELLDVKLDENQLTEIGALVLKARRLASNDSFEASGKGM